VRETSVSVIHGEAVINSTCTVHVDQASWRTSMLAGQFLADKLVAQWLWLLTVQHEDSNLAG
jgi:hypothetical protein